MPTVIHLRAETKPYERRSPCKSYPFPQTALIHTPINNTLLTTHVCTVSPEGVRALLDAGYIVHVERHSDRIYKDHEFEAVGAELVPAGSWRDVPTTNIILGLKELPDVDVPLAHTHVTFLHVFKVDFKHALLAYSTQCMPGH